MRRAFLFAAAGAGWIGTAACSDTTASQGLVVDSVAVAPETASIRQGDTLRLVGTPLDQNGVAFLGPKVRWLSDNPSVALVAPDGLVTGGLPGTAVITANVGALSGQAEITVSAAPFAVVSPSTLTFNATAGGTNPPDQTANVSNAGGGSLTDVTVGAVAYGQGQPTGWLTGALSADFSTITIRVSIAGLGAGTYDATVPIGIGGSTASGGNLSVTLVVS